MIKRRRWQKFLKGDCFIVHRFCPELPPTPCSSYFTRFHWKPILPWSLVFTFDLVYQEGACLPNCFREFRSPWRPRWPKGLTVFILALHWLFAVWSVLRLDCRRRAKRFGWQTRYGVMAMALHPRGTLIQFVTFFPLAKRSLRSAIISGSYYWLRCPSRHLCSSRLSRYNQMAEHQRKGCCGLANGTGWWKSRWGWRGTVPQFETRALWL